jgi:hypothetical protein
LALAATNTDAMEIDLTELTTDSEAKSQKVAALFGELSQILAPKTEEMESHFKEIVRGLQLYSDDILITIYRIRNDQKGKSTALTA